MYDLKSLSEILIPKDFILNLPYGVSIDIESLENDCSHMFYEEKILFTSTYKICTSCKKEFE